MTDRRDDLICELMTWIAPGTGSCGGRIPPSLAEVAVEYSQELADAAASARVLPAWTATIPGTAGLRLIASRTYAQTPSRHPIEWLRRWIEGGTVIKPGGSRVGKSLAVSERLEGDRGRHPVPKHLHYEGCPCRVLSTAVCNCNEQDGGLVDRYRGVQVNRAPEEDG